MNLSNISVGFIAKNYKHLCEILGEEVQTAGNAKKNQMKRWACYFDARKQEGQKIKIVEIYKEPKPLPKRGGSHNTLPYTDHIKQLVIQTLLCSETKSISLPKYSLLKNLNMINENYKDCKMHVPSLSEFMNIEESDIYEFYDTTDGLLKRSLEKSLNELQSKAHIIYEKVIMVNVKGETRRCTEEERELILEVRGQALKEMMYDNPATAIREGKYEEYLRKVNHLLFDLAQIRFVFEVYDISLNKERLKDELIKMGKEEKLQLELLLNDEIQLRLQSNIIKRHKRAKEKDDDDRFFVSLNKNEERRLNEDYKEIQDYLIGVLIDCRFPPITEDIRKITRKRNVKVEEKVIEEYINKSN